jgi:hypothetical protein
MGNPHSCVYSFAYELVRFSMEKIMTSVDTRYVATLPVSQPSSANTATGNLPGAGIQMSRATGGADWFSPTQATEHRPITVGATAAAATVTTLDALTREILSHIGEY